jgi:hypothetical protein
LWLVVAAVADRHQVVEETVVAGVVVIVLALLNLFPLVLLTQSQ